MKKPLLNIDTYLCNGCGSCAEICPEVFLMDKAGGKAVLVVDLVEITENIRKAVAFCPEKCIEIKDR